LLQKGEEELVERRIVNANLTTFQNFLGGCTREGCSGVQKSHE
jgi:hypothetical protein